MLRRTTCVLARGMAETMADVPLFIFGLVADVQAGDKPDTIGEGRVQRYSTATTRLSRALDAWLDRINGSSTSNPPPTMVLSLGDIVDGRDSEEATVKDLTGVTAEFNRLPDSCPAVHVLGNHCIKSLPRKLLMDTLGMSAAYYRRELTSGWALIVLDTTDLSTHGGWPEGSDKAQEASAFLAAHEGEERMQRYNGGVGAEQLKWLRSELAKARESRCRLIVASHHCLARGACRETHRAWNGDEVSAMLEASGVVALALAGHDHVGGYLSTASGVSYVTVEALLEAPVDGNAYAVVSIYANQILIDGCGTTVSNRALPLLPLPS